ncbi:sensor histidine kinase [Dyella nitratireducens]|uniref:Alginate biosynthesis protein AlgZ/FimS n=1 Tax=Dyella nitratireducens TaxID=1849580 RepID=A0ABQ1FV80_9GAMM|nr:histidine kinase [Dyella nitratireducens]GGA30574.1 alginate biosynthesis protein AlgZ/FimS [Dyella nitratireducens]GLQ42986.1 alginate biosynthesis protein AlgZ/FimS [Dyella nitratireducens]
MPGTANQPSSQPRSPLPDFCSLPVISALLVVGALCVTLAWLAPQSTRGWRGYSVGMLFVEWVAMVIGVALCKLRPWLLRLPGLLPYAGVWLVMVLIVILGSVMAQWMDTMLEMQLIPAGSNTFVRDNALIAALLGAAMLRYFYVLAEWQARLAAVAHAKVEALQARIRPHFLFNSMNTVAALVRVDPDAAERTVEDLSELFRAALGQDDTHNGTLDEELKLVDRYLDIEQLRLGERLRVRREIHDLPLDASMPVLLLQPLVENAVRHGVQPLREGGEVVLRGTRDGGMMRIEIDNPLAETPAIGGSGHGLNNVRQRVAYHFGPRASMDAGPLGNRFVVTLQLPIEMRHARTDR